MGEDEGVPRSYGAGPDSSHLLRFRENGEEFVDICLADLRQEPKAETAPDHRGSRKRALFILVEPLQTALDYEADVFRDVGLFDRDVRTELASRIEDFSFFDQMPIYFLYKERI